MVVSHRVIVPLALATLVALMVGGCAAGRARGPRAAATAPAGDVAGQPVGPRGDAFLTLDEIEPRPELATVEAAAAAATQPSTRPSVDALTLYAQAVDALQTGRRFSAI